MLLRYNSQWSHNAIFSFNFLLKLEKLTFLLFDRSLSLSLSYLLCYGPATIPSAVLLCADVVPHSCISLRELYSTVLCYCVIHHPAATCSHFYHWYSVKQILNTTTLLETQQPFRCVDVNIKTDSVWRVWCEGLRCVQAICCIPHFIPSTPYDDWTAFCNKRK